MKFITKGVAMIVLIGLSVMGTQAQKLSKAEKKALKKEAKAMYKDPSKLKALKDAKQKTEEALDSNKKEVLKLKASQHDFEQRESVMLSTIDSLSARWKRAEERIKELEKRKPVAAANSTATVKGVVFKVQVGAYKNKSFNYNNSNTDYSNENANGYNKHVLGAFKQYQAAKSFADHLVQLGIKGAWVVAFKDGNRITIKEALGGTSTSNEEGGK